MTSLLSPREWAIITWLAILFVLALLKKGIRTSFVSLVRSILRWKILAAFGIVVVYAGAVVYLCQSIGLVHNRIWIDACLWLFYGFFVVGKYISKEGYTNLWRDVARENVSAVVVLELIVNTYTFDFTVEMIILPVIVFISVVGAVSGTDNELKPVEKLANWSLTLIGFALLGYAITRAIESPGLLKNIDTLSDVFFPIVLTLGFSPFVYVFFVISNYEQLFIRLDMGASKSKRLKLRAKWELFKSLRLSRSRLSSFMDTGNAALMKVTSIEDVRELLQEYE